MASSQHEFSTDCPTGPSNGARIGQAERVQVRSFEFNDLVLTLRCPSMTLCTSQPGPTVVDLTEFVELAELAESTELESGFSQPLDMSISQRRAKASAEALVRALLLVSLETIAGQRGQVQLERLMNRRSALGVLRMRNMLPPLSGQQPRQMTQQARVRTFQPNVDVIEATIIFPIEPVRAAALRLERAISQWQCVVFKLL